VVGEIEDEYDRAPASSPWVRKLAKRDFLVNARIEVGALRHEFGIALPKGDYQTLAGFLTNMATEIPIPGRIIRYKKYSFTIEQATDRAIQEVRIRW
jgi:putative hemolysin